MRQLSTAQAPPKRSVGLSWVPLAFHSLVHRHPPQGLFKSIGQGAHHPPTHNGHNTFCHPLQHIGSWGGGAVGVSRVLALHHGVGWGGSLRSCLSWALPPPPASRKVIDFLLGCPTTVWESYHCHSTGQLPSGHGEASPGPLLSHPYSSALYFPTDSAPL